VRDVRGGRLGGFGDGSGGLGEKEEEEEGVGFELVLKKRWGGIKSDRRKVEYQFREATKGGTAYLEHEEDALRQDGLEDLGTHALVPSGEALSSEIKSAELPELYLSGSKNGLEQTHLLLIDPGQDLDRALGTSRFRLRLLGRGRGNITLFVLRRLDSGFGSVGVREPTSAGRGGGLGRKRSGRGSSGSGCGRNGRGVVDVLGLKTNFGHDLENKVRERLVSSSTQDCIGSQEMPGVRKGR
jgi:hypothetical protein